MRSRIGASGARCSSRAHATASAARANAATKLSPSPCSTGRTPSWAATTAETVWLRRAIAAVISSGWVCHSRVELSTSAKSSVTVPVGRSPLTPSSLQFNGVSAWELMVAERAATTSPKHQRKRVRLPGCHADLAPGQRMRGLVYFLPGFVGSKFAAEPLPAPLARAFPPSRAVYRYLAFAASRFPQSVVELTGL